MEVKLGTTMPFSKEFLHNKRDTMIKFLGIFFFENEIFVYKK